MSLFFRRFFVLEFLVRFLCDDWSYGLLNLMEEDISVDVVFLVFLFES